MPHSVGLWNCCVFFFCNLLNMLFSLLQNQCKYSIGNHMIVNAIIKDLHNKWYLKIHSKLQVKFGQIFKHHEYSLNP